jgi:hypothetical protein
MSVAATDVATQDLAPSSLLDDDVAVTFCPDYAEREFGD